MRTVSERTACTVSYTMRERYTVCQRSRSTKNVSPSRYSFTYTLSRLCSVSAVIVKMRSVSEWCECSVSVLFSTLRHDTVALISSTAKNATGIFRRNFTGPCILSAHRSKGKPWPRNRDVRKFSPLRTPISARSARCEGFASAPGCVYLSA